MFVAATGALLALSAGLILWVTGLCLLAMTDDRQFALPFVAASIAILFLLTVGLLLPDR